VRSPDDLAAPTGAVGGRRPSGSPCGVARRRRAAAPAGGRSQSPSRIAPRPSSSTRTPALAPRLRSCTGTAATELVHQDAGDRAATPRPSSCTRTIAPDAGDRRSEFGGAVRGVKAAIDTPRSHVRRAGAARRARPRKASGRASPRDTEACRGALRSRIGAAFRSGALRATRYSRSHARFGGAARDHRCLDTPSCRCVSTRLPRRKGGGSVAWP